MLSIIYSLLKIDNALWYIEILKIPSVKNMVLLCLSLSQTYLPMTSTPFFGTIRGHHAQLSGIVWEGIVFYTTDLHQHLDFNLKKLVLALGSRGSSYIEAENLSRANGFWAQSLILTFMRRTKAHCGHSWTHVSLCESLLALPVVSQCG